MSETFLAFDADRIKRSVTDVWALLHAVGLADYGESESVPAVLGVLSGSWSQEVAARIPSGCRVIIRTHNDSAGQKYCREIAESLCDRCHVEVLRHG